MYTDTDIYYDEERILQAKDLISDWENVKAKRVLEEILQDDPLCETAHYLLGWIYDHRYDEAKEALHYYHNAIKINPHYYEALADFTKLLNEEGKPKLVLKYGEKAVARCSKFQNYIHFEMILAYEKLKQFEKAISEIIVLKFKTTDDSLLEELDKVETRVISKLELKNQESIPKINDWNIQFVNTT